MAKIHTSYPFSYWLQGYFLLNLTHGYFIACISGYFVVCSYFLAPEYSSVSYQAIFALKHTLFLYFIHYF